MSYQPCYSIVDLTVSLAEATRPRGINNAGHVVGHTQRQFDEEQAFVWRDGATHMLGCPPERRSIAVAINDDDVIAGSTLLGEATGKACMWLDGRFVDLSDSSPVSCSASAINSIGQIVGTVINFNSLTSSHRPKISAFLYSHGVMRELSVEDETNSAATGINDHGTIVGHAYGKRIPEQQAVLWDRGLAEYMFPGHATGVNARGQAIGYNNTSPSGSRAFLWQQGELIKLGVPNNFDAATAQPLGINRDGQIVGAVSNPGTGVERACLWREDKSYDLNALISAAERWILQLAIAINDCGQIVGEGIHKRRQSAFLLNPI